MARVDMRVTVVAKADSNQPDGVDFKMVDPDSGDQIDVLTFDKRKFQGMKKKDEHQIAFELEQENGLTLEFAHSPDEALWVVMGTNDQDFPDCPKTQPAKSTIFFAEKSTPRKLTAVNTNPERKNFSFALNFVDRTNQGPKKLITYDPPGSNHNGGIDGRSEDISSGVILGAVAAVAVLAVAFLALK